LIEIIERSLRTKKTAKKRREDSIAKQITKTLKSGNGCCKFKRKRKHYLFAEGDERMMLLDQDKIHHA
jgi:hypothetical protein